MEIRYKLDRIRLKVRVSKMISELRRYDYIDTISEEESEEINNFVKEHNLGVRVAWDQWRFKDSASVTMFMLRYG